VRREDWMEKKGEYKKGDIISFKFREGIHTGEVVRIMDVVKPVSYIVYSMSCHGYVSVFDEDIIGVSR
jgi:hypothetical protein